MSEERIRYSELRDQFRKIASIAESMATYIEVAPSDSLNDCAIMDAIWSIRNLSSDLKTIHKQAMVHEGDE